MTRFDGFDRRRLTLLAGALLVCAVALLAAGCGSDSDSTGGSSDATTGGEAEASSPKVAEAQEFVEEHIQPPASVGEELTPLSKRPPSGKTMLYMDCGIPLCKQIGEGVQGATEALGWKFKRLLMGSVPEQISAAWDTAVQMKPDAMSAAGIPVVLYEKQLAELAKGGTLYAADGVLEKPGNGLTAAIGSEPWYVENGKWLARWAAAKTDGEAHVMWLTSSEYPVVKPQGEWIKKELEAICPDDCTFEEQNFPVDTIGKQLPGEVVSALQRSPETNYLILAFGDLSLGLPQALQAAGLSDKVGIAGWNPASTNLEQILNGEEAGAVVGSNLVIGWTMVDSIARAMVGDDLPYAQYESPPLQYVTADNVGNPNAPFIGITDYQEQFKKLWNVEG